jgi:hypothetical protein
MKFQNMVLQPCYSDAIRPRLFLNRCPLNSLKTEAKNYLSPDINLSLSALAEQEFQRGVTIEMLDYAA